MNKGANFLVSVIIPNYNCAEFLPRAIESVVQQTFSRWEIIIIDNYSTDESDAVIKNYLNDRIHLLKVNNNGVIAASRNLGVKNAKGKWIAFLDADDWWMNDKLEASINFIDESKADIVYHDLYLVGKSKKILLWQRTWGADISKDSWTHLFYDGNVLSNSSVVVRKSALEKIGYLSEDRDCISWEDFDTWLRLAKGNFKFRKLNGIYGYYWIGGGNISNPEQHLKNINSFTLKYVEEKNKIPWWCYYIRGTAFKELKKYDESISNFRLVLANTSSLMIKLKSVIRIVQIFLTISIKKYI